MKNHTWADFCEQMKIRPLPFHGWDAPVLLHSPALNVTLSSNLGFHLSMKLRCPPSPSFYLSKLKSFSSILSSSPLTFPTSLPSLQNAQSCSIAPEFLGTNTNRGSSAHLIHNKCVYAACGGKKCALLAGEKRQMTAVNVLPTAFQKFSLFPTDTRVSARGCVFRDWKKKQPQNKERRSRWSGCLTMNQSALGFETYALFLKPRDTFVHTLSHSDICCGFFHISVLW